MELLVVSGGYADSRATILFRFAGDGPKTEDESDLQGFSLDGTNEAKALCRGAELIIEDSGKPECVYYGWNPFSDGNLVNSENLPASTFRIRVK
jgi:sialate O-acetylesterase